MMAGESIEVFPEEREGRIGHYDIGLLQEGDTLGAAKVSVAGKEG